MSKDVNAEFQKGIKLFKLKNTEATKELRDAIILADSEYRKINEVSKQYIDYLTGKGYTGVITRILHNPILKSLELFGFSADQEIKDENFNSAKVKFNTTYYPLKKTKFNKELTNDFNYCHTSYNDVCELMIGKISAKQYTPTPFNPQLGSIFMLYFKYHVKDDGNDIQMIIHETDMKPTDAKLVANDSNTSFKLQACDGAVYKFVMENFEEVEQTVTEEG